MNNNFSPDKPPLNSESAGLIKMVGQSLPFLPLLFEQFTGQKVPPISGTMAEIQLTLNQVMANQQVIVQNQQQFAQRLTNLENQATQQFTNLSHQVQSIKSIRLTHDRERKQIDYQLNPRNHESN